MCFQQSLTCYRRYLQTCTVIVWKNCEGQKLLADVANLDGTRNCSRYFLFHCIFACFSKTCVFNKVLRVTKSIWKLAEQLLEFSSEPSRMLLEKSLMLKKRETVGKNRLFHGEERFLVNFSIDLLVHEKQY